MWLDLSSEPYILHVPDEAGRFYRMPMLDECTNVFPSPGKRTTKAADYAITGPHWKGALPRSVAQYTSPTDIVWIIGRTSSPALPRISRRFTQFRTNIRLKTLSA